MWRCSKPWWKATDEGELEDRPVWLPTLSAWIVRWVDNELSDVITVLIDILYWNCLYFFYVYLTLIIFLELNWRLVLWTSHQWVGFEMAQPGVSQGLGNACKFESGCKGPECVTDGALKTTNLFMKLKCQVHIYST